MITFKATRATRITHLQIGKVGAPSYRSILLAEPIDLAEGEEAFFELIDEDDAEAQMLQGSRGRKA